jgi:hypothetical protein
MHTKSHIKTVCKNLAPTVSDACTPSFLELLHVEKQHSYLINLETKTRETLLPVRNIKVPSKKFLFLILGFVFLVVALVLWVVPAIMMAENVTKLRTLKSKDSLTEIEIQQLSILMRSKWWWEKMQMTVFNPTMTILLIFGIALTAYYLATRVPL